MRLTNLLTFEKCVKIMEAYSKIGLHYIVYAFNNVLGGFINDLKIKFRGKYAFFKYNQYVY